jgi:hypothetical protein
MESRNLHKYPKVKRKKEKENRTHHLPGTLVLKKKQT